MNSEAVDNRPRIVVYSPDHVRAARAPGRPVLLVSPPGAGLSHGYLWFKSLIGPEDEGLFDCADSPGAALAALRQGAKRLRIEPGLPAFPRLTEIAARHGAQIEEKDQSPELDLLDCRDPRSRCQEWFDREG